MLKLLLILVQTAWISLSRLHCVGAVRESQPEATPEGGGEETKCQCALKHPPSIVLD
jgi:hypothetical protein